jgi:hypothetical protein
LPQAAQGEAAASQETRSRAARLTPSQIQKSRYLSAMAGLRGPGWVVTCNEQRGNLQPQNFNTVGKSEKPPLGG